MNSPLYIVWNKKQTISVPILDDQHHAIVAAINSLYFFINQGWGLSALSPTLKVIKSNVDFHLKTEEGILEKLGANYKIMLKHSEIQNAFNINADGAAQQAINEQDPMILLKFLRDWWETHHFKTHAEYQQYLSSISVPDDDL
jgi:hemerythrin-like metal-binding protein